MSGRLSDIDEILSIFEGLGPEDQELILTVVKRLAFSSKETARDEQRPLRPLRPD